MLHTHFQVAVGSFTLVAVLILAQAVCSAESSLSSQQAREVDELFAQWDQPDSPGAALGVIKDGKLIYSRGYGLADLEHDIPIDASTVFYMASVSKHFVTMCVLLLEEQGKLDLDDEIQIHLPDFPRYEDPLTIRHFIHHTSGVRDNLTLWRLAGNSYLDYVDKAGIYDLIKRQKSLNFKPGDKYLYSNSCYFMLGLIVERASGLSLRDYAQKHMFEPLGMTHTRFHDDVDEIIRNRAFSYNAGRNGFENIIMRYDLVGSGGLYSNIEDMAKWDANFNDNRLGKGGPPLIQKMLEEGSLNDGESAGYAFGLKNGTYRGLETVSHGGSLAGYRTYFLRFPSQQVSIVLLSNASNLRPGLARDVAGVVLGELLDPVEPSAKPQFLTAEQLAPFAGTYGLDPGREINVTVQQGGLQISHSWSDSEFVVSAIGRNQFVHPQDAGRRFEFVEVTDGQAQQMRIISSDRAFEIERKSEDETGRPDPSEYTGSYYSEDLDVVYELFADGGELKGRIRHRYGAPWQLGHVTDDEFMGAGTEIQFVRGQGKVIGFKLDAGRVKNLHFEKQ